MSKLIESQPSRLKDPAFLAAHLFLEELGEGLQALGRRDKIGFLDFLGDFLYILCGRAAQFGLPLEEAFAEIHRSNMTKEKQPNDPAAARVRVKGPNYTPPNLFKVLEDQNRK
jgi:predicted HAD superfamily Cof-like phosphohydrolase